MGQRLIAAPEVAFNVLQPCLSNWISTNKVSPYVNKVRNQDPNCVGPEDDEDQLEANGADGGTRTRTIIRSRDFLTRYGFHRRRMKRRLWPGLSLHHSRLARP